MADESVQVVHGPEQFDLGVDAGGAAVVQMASGSLEQLRETALDQGASAGLELTAGRPAGVARRAAMSR
jgi:hypothetical protein